MTPPVRPVSENTALSPAEEQQFRAWAGSNGITDVDHPNAHYDYRGFWKETGGKPVRYGVDHFPDTYKQHGHPTFSVESRYSSGPNDGGHWSGEQYVPQASRPDPRIVANLRRLKAAGAPDEALEAYLTEEAAKPHTTIAQRAAARTRLNTNDMEQARAETPDYLTQVLGGIASFGKAIPGMEALQAGMRASGPPPEAVAAMARHPLPSSNADQPQSYSSALSDIKGAEADAPAVVRIGNSIAGGAIPAAMMPGGPLLSGARTGALSGLLGSDPTTSMAGRAGDAVLQGVVGGLAGKTAEVGGTLLRGLLAPTLGKATAARAATMATKDAAAYGTAASEGAASPASSAVDAVLDAPGIKPFADMIRESRKFVGANQGTVLSETYKLMSKQQSGLAKRLTDQGFDAVTKLAHDNIALAKQELMAAADQIMPSFRSAVSGHAEMMSQKGAFDTAAEATKRLLKGTHVAAKKLATNSPEAVTETFKQMKEEAAKSALEGTLGRLNEYNRVSFNPFKLFGAGPAVRNASKVAPQVGLLDQIAGTGVKSKALRAAIVSGLLSTMH